ncbi:MAG: hypothetical protein AAFU38_01040 [Bacteroidota bacterium]
MAYPIPATPSARWAMLAYLGVVAVLAYVAALAVEGADLAARAYALRYVGLLVAGGVAIAVPHVLFPDPETEALHLANPSPAALLRRVVRRWGAVVVATAVPLAVLPLGALGTASGSLVAVRVAEAILFGVGLGLYALGRYADLGARSQAWGEGQAGHLYRRYKAAAPGFAFLVPNGVVPGLFTTGRIFLVGSAAVIVATALDGRGLGLWSWTPSLVLLALALARLLRLRAAFDAAFYHTHAFYAEAFAEPDVVLAEGRAAAPYDAVYWMPSALRPPTWATLTQLDRTLPLGRFVFLALALLAVLFLIDAPAQTLTVALGAFVVLKNAALLRVVGRGIAPAPFDLWMQQPSAWVWVRFGLSARWAFPLALLLVLAVWLDPNTTWAMTGGWIALDLLAAAVFALAATLRTEVAYRRQFR